ncbi:NUDIX hydrolase [Longimicrobium sp.]|uniref:NUDIX hydrolase n=1 Tax=Longimicrobium sp. TaxID=2029185 RepID=UPI002C81E7EC|nr:NUDIX domain-containing protein [Longimicrobium sp.]HSU15297.1 NUDIX domain-containing protein [Longimicrobium sp.]
MSEMVNHVDENDQELGVVSRAEAHRDGLLHRAVHVLAQDRQGRWILQQRSTSRTMNPGLWTSTCSGHVDPGEAYEDAALREAREELGLEIHKLLPVSTLLLEATNSTAGERCRAFTRVFVVGEFIDADALRPNEETEGFHGMGTGEIAELIHTPLLREDDAGAAIRFADNFPPVFSAVFNHSKTCLQFLHG